MNIEVSDAIGLWSIEIHILAKMQTSKSPCSTVQCSLIQFRQNRWFVFPQITLTHLERNASKIIKCLENKLTCFQKFVGGKLLLNLKVWFVLGFQNLQINVLVVSEKNGKGCFILQKLISFFSFGSLRKHFVTWVTLKLLVNSSMCSSICVKGF